MINIIIALRVWKESWRGKYIHFWVDNEAVVTIYNSGYTRDSALASYARNIWLITSIYHINLTVSHIAGKNNSIADLPSRWENSKNYKDLACLVPDCTWKQMYPDMFDINNDIYIDMWLISGTHGACKGLASQAQKRIKQACTSKTWESYNNVFHIAHFLPVYSH